MNVGIKSLHPDDYSEVATSLSVLKSILSNFRQSCPTARIDAPDVLPNPHKMWEWSRAVHAIQSQNKSGQSVLDVGASFSLLGPALAYLGHSVTEAEIDEMYRESRTILNNFLIARDTTPIRWMPVGFGSLPRADNCTNAQGQYDVVMSISVVEHLPPSLEKLVWKEMADMVKPGGLLIVTVDLVQEAVRLNYSADEAINYFDMSIIRKRVAELRDYGFVPYGDEDYEWHGAHVTWPGAPVEWYSFGSIIMMKENNK